MLVTGAARGQGRSHALRFAAEGADLVLLDACQPIASVTSYPLARPEDLDRTTELVTAAGVRAIALICDVRERRAMDEAVERTLREFGQLDVVVANAGIAVYGRLTELSDEAWDDVLATDLVGVWNTVSPALSALRQARGSVVVTSSLCGLRGVPHLAAYVAAKHGLVGLGTALAEALETAGVRVNVVCPGAVDAPPGRLSTGVPAAVSDRSFTRFFEPALPVGALSVEDISDLVAWLGSPNCSLTGAVIPVDAGASGR